MQVKVNPEFVRDNEIKELCGSNALLNQLINKVPHIKLEETLASMLADKWI